MGSPKNGLSYFLPKGHVLVTLTWNPSVRSWDVAPTVMYEADPTARFDVDWTNSVLSDKDTNVSVDPATGLLQTINAGPTGLNVNSVGTEIGAAPNVLHLGTMIAPISAYDGSAFTAAAFDDWARRSPASIARDSENYPATAQVVVNDDDRTEAVALVASPDGSAAAGGARPPKVYAAIKVRLTPKFELGAEFPKNKKWTIASNGKGGGIAVRLPIPFELQVQEVVSADGTFRDTTRPRTTYAIVPRTILLPDSKHDFLYRILGRPLASDSTKVALSNGMIQSLEQVRPSILSALLQIPKYLVTNVVPIPVEIDQTQQTISNSQSKLNNSRADGSTATEDR